MLDHVAFRYLSALWLACAIPFYRWPRGQRADRTGTAVLGDDDLPGRGRKQISSRQSMVREEFAAEAVDLEHHSFVLGSRFHSAAAVAVVKADCEPTRSGNLGGLLCDFRPHHRPVHCVEYYSLEHRSKRRERSYRPSP